MAEKTQPSGKMRKPVVKPAGKEKSSQSEIAGKTVRKDPAVTGHVANADIQETLAHGALGAEILDEAKRAAEATWRKVQAEQASAEHFLPKKTAKPGSSTDKATILGDFKLLKKLGQGGMGTVYKAKWISKDSEVALKVLSKAMASNPSFIERFKREGRAMQKLDHPNALRCLHVDEAKGFHFLAMEIVDGGSVESWLKKLGRFSIGDALHILLTTAGALQHAHDKSIIHRDVKPDNILLTKEGIIKVADLGLAKDTEDISLTTTGAGAGTPIYMAPEQARDVKHVDVRVDIYALGVMLYVMLTGQPPFQGTTIVELIAAKEKGKFDPMRRLNDEVPTRLDLIVDKMIAKDPKSRYASCQEVIDEITPLGLENKTLSFLEEDDETLAPSKLAGKGSKTSGPKKGAAKTGVGASAEDDIVADVWYWKTTTPDGKASTKKANADQIRTLIKAGHIDKRAQLSKTAKAGFRGAGTFIDFQGAFKARETANKADASGGKYRDKVKEIDLQDARRRRWGWIFRGAKNLGGRLFGLLWIALILGIVGAAGYLGYMHFMQ